MCALALTRPLTDELIVLMCDAQRRGVGLTSLADARLADHVHDLIAACSATLDVESLVVVECRALARPDSPDVLFDARLACTRAGLELRDVVVVERGSIRSWTT